VPAPVEQRVIRELLVARFVGGKRTGRKLRGPGSRMMSMILLRRMEISQVL
jgi:molybdenum-dependent DNA-binding transcriptional regulator ModE